MISRWVQKYALEIIGILIGAIIIMLLFGNPAGSGTPDRVISETERLYKQNDALLQKVIKAHEDQIQAKDQQITTLNAEREALLIRILSIDQKSTTIKAAGNEKVTRVYTYNADDITSYLSGLDSTRSY